MITIQQIPLEKIRGKRILVLIDPNIENAVPTLGSLIGKSAKVVVATHVQACRGQNPKRLELDFAKQLSHSLGLPVTKLDCAVGSEVTRSAMEIKPNEIILLENLGIYQQDAANDVDFARQLASFCDLFVDDAFEVSHRALASNVGITRWIPISVVGPWLAARVKELEDFSKNPPRPFLAIIGGSHIQTKLSLIEALLPNLDRLFVGGALAFSFLKAMGRETGKAPIASEFPVEFIRALARKAETKTELVLPGDFIVRAGNRGRCARLLSPDDVPVDIGAQSIARLVDFMSSAYGVLWVDSLSVYPEEAGPRSDWDVLQQLYGTIPRRWQRVVLAGCELVSSLSGSADSSPFSQLSLFGDAALNVIAGRRLPAIDALRVDGVAKDHSVKLSGSNGLAGGLEVQESR